MNKSLREWKRYDRSRQDFTTVAIVKGLLLRNLILFLRENTSISGHCSIINVEDGHLGQFGNFDNFKVWRHCRERIMLAHPDGLGFESSTPPRPPGQSQQPVPALLLLFLC